MAEDESLQAEREGDTRKRGKVQPAPLRHLT